MKARNLYDTLEVDPTASPKEIKQAFHKKAKQFHPDKIERNESATGYGIYQEAYGVLSDSKKRARYDRSIGIRRQFGLSAGEIDSDFLQGPKATGHSMQQAYLLRSKYLQTLQYVRQLREFVTQAFRSTRDLFASLRLLMVHKFVRQKSKFERVPIHDLQSLPIFPGEIVKIVTPIETSGLSELLTVLRQSFGENQNIYRATLVELTFPSSEREPTLLVAMHAGMKQSDNVVLFRENATSNDRPLFLLAGTDPFSEVVIERGLEFYPRAV